MFEHVHSKDAFAVDGMYLILFFYYLDTSPGRGKRIFCPQMRGSVS